MKNAFKFGFLALGIALSVTACHLDGKGKSTEKGIDSLKAIDSAKAVDSLKKDSAATADTTKKDTTKKQ